MGGKRRIGCFLGRRVEQGGWVGGWVEDLHTEAVGEEADD